MSAIHRRFGVLYSVLCAAPWQWEKFGPRLSAKHSDHFLFSSFPAWNQGLGEKKVGSDENLRTKGLLWVTSINKVLHIPIDPHIYHLYTKGWLANLPWVRKIKNLPDIWKQTRKHFVFTPLPKLFFKALGNTALPSACIILILTYWCLGLVLPTPDGDIMNDNAFNCTLRIWKYFLHKYKHIIPFAWLDLIVVINVLSLAIFSQYSSI